MSVMPGHKHATHPLAAILLERSFELPDENDTDAFGARFARALEACRAQMPDVVLVNLGNAGGLELVRAIRRGRTQKQPVIIATMTEHDVGHISEALNAGADEYVLKPLDGDVLKEKFTQTGLL